MLSVIFSRDNPNGVKKENIRKNEGVMSVLRIAAVCMNSPPGEIDHNLKKIETFAAQASEQGIDII